MERRSRLPQRAESGRVHAFNFKFEEKLEWVERLLQSVLFMRRLVKRGETRADSRAAGRDRDPSRDHGPSSAARF